MLWLEVCGHSIQAELVKLGVNDLPAPFRNIEARYGCMRGTAESCARSWSASACFPFSVTCLYALSNCLFCRQQVIILVSVVIAFFFVVVGNAFPSYFKIILCHSHTSKYQVSPKFTEEREEEFRRIHMLFSIHSLQF